jgi:hypothetical protein
MLKLEEQVLMELVRILPHCSTIVNEVLLGQTNLLK